MAVFFSILSQFINALGILRIGVGIVLFGLAMLVLAISAIGLLDEDEYAHAPEVRMHYDFDWDKMTWLFSAEDKKAEA